MITLKVTFTNGDVIYFEDMSEHNAAIFKAAMDDPRATHIRHYKEI